MSLSHLLAHRTDKGALILALEQVDNNTIVPLEVPFPRDVGQFHQLLISSTLPVWLLDVRFLQNTVQVLVQSIQQKSDQLLGIVLLIANKLRGESLKDLFELSRGVRGCCRRVGPDPSKQSAEGFRNSALHSEWVFRVELSFEYSCCRCVLSTLLALAASVKRTDKVLADLLGVCQTLEGRIHEASVSPIMDEQSNEGVKR